MQNSKFLFARISIVVMLFLVLGTSLAYSGAGQTGAIFLAIGVGARPEGMGGAFAAIANDPSAVNINPAGMVQVKTSQVTVMHNESLFDIKQEYVSYVAADGGKKALGGSLVYLNLGSQQSYSPANQPTGTFKSGDFSAGVAYARRVKPSLSYGVGLKFIRQKLASNSGSAFAIDFGLLLKPTNAPLTYGIVLQNLGTSIKVGNNRDPLPLTLRAGTAYQFDTLPLVVAADAYFIRNTDPEIHIGGEYRIQDTLALRAGYNSDDDLDNGFTFGIGFSQPEYDIDYAFVPYGVFGDSHRFSLTMKF